MSEGKRRKRIGLLPRLRLRHKLGVSLVIAALLPVIVASYVAFSVVLRGLNTGLEVETKRQLSVGLNLVLRRIENLGNEAAQLASSRELEQAVAGGTVTTAAAIERLSTHLSASLLQVADADGALLAHGAARSWPARFEGLAVSARDPLIAAGRELEQRVTVTRVGSALVARAVAPITDEHFRLAGMVILSVPLDGVFADELKASLGSDVLLFTGTEGTTPAKATFVDPLGRRAAGIQIERRAASVVATGETTLGSAAIEGSEFTLGYAPIMSAGGEIVGAFAVAIDRGPVVNARRTAFRSLAFGAAGAFLFAVGLAGLLSRRISRPLSRLHQGATAIARGDLDHEIGVEEGDEIGDLATAFGNMTDALKLNQRRLAARMREIVALHDAGRAVSSVIDLEQVLRKIVDSVARVLHVRVCAIWIVDDPAGARRRMTLGAARAKRSDMRMISRGDEVAAMVEPLVVVAREVAAGRATLRVDDVEADETWREAAIAAGVTGSLVATPLERKGTVLGVIVIGRTDEARPFSEADSNLLATFADQAAAAIENASLYAEVRAFNEELEAKVKLRTMELTAINAELGRAITELRETQAQLILSERLASLGQLVAGVAHEINSPSAAIRGTIDVLPDTVKRLANTTAALYRAGLSGDEDAELAELVTRLGARRATTRVMAPAAVRRASQKLGVRLEEGGIDADEARPISRALTELRLEPQELDTAVGLVVASPSRGELVAAYLREQMYLHRAVATIGAAIVRIQRIVGGLKSYSHLDQDASRIESDIHEGIESTLVLFDHVISRGISVVRKYGEVPPVWVYVDELNQVWTNLIHNAVQAMGGSGIIEIETSVVSAKADDGSLTRAIQVLFTDDGGGIEPEIIKQIFEPFFTTKQRGEGTGLGLGIAQKIVQKHGGVLNVRSVPRRTTFETILPLLGESDSEVSIAPGETHMPDEGAHGAQG